jgi:hypothetical protein
MITIVMPYYENGGMLERHLQEWESYAPHVKESFRAVIVDDGSPNDPAIKHMRDPGFHVELWRIKQNVPWNIPGARNLGMHVAPKGLCLLTDIDHLLSAKDAELLAATIYVAGKPRTAYTMQRRWADGRPLHPHPNSYVLERYLYWQAGGTDEDFSGRWGAGEAAFRKSLNVTARNIVLLNDVYLTHYGRDDIPDASTREWGRKGSAWDYNHDPKLKAKARGPAYKPENPLRFDWEQVQFGEVRSSKFEVPEKTSNPEPRTPNDLGGGCG